MSHKSPASVSVCCTGKHATTGWHMSQAHGLCGGSVLLVPPSLRAGPLRLRCRLRTWRRSGRSACIAPILWPHVSPAPFRQTGFGGQACTATPAPDTHGNRGRRGGGAHGDVSLRFPGSWPSLSTSWPSPGLWLSMRGEWQPAWPWGKPHMPSGRGSAAGRAACVYSCRAGAGQSCRCQESSRRPIWLELDTVSSSGFREGTCSRDVRSKGRRD